MAKYHIINTTTNIVENTVEWDGDTNKWNPEDGYVAVGSTICGIGWKYNSGGVGIGTTSGDADSMWIPQVGYATTI
tara:strand:- start:822 stop:1049 length:228 start_codon:yes stop_codon:yes gene_type:complete